MTEMLELACLMSTVDELRILAVQARLRSAQQYPNDPSPAYWQGVCFGFELAADKLEARLREITTST